MRWCYATRRACRYGTGDIRKSSGCSIAFHPLTSKQQCYKLLRNSLSVCSLDCFLHDLRRALFAVVIEQVELVFFRGILELAADGYVRWLRPREEQVLLRSVGELSRFHAVGQVVVIVRRLGRGRLPRVLIAFVVALDLAFCVRGRGGRLELARLLHRE